MEIYLYVFAISCLLTDLVRRHALKKAILDIPNERSSHQIPTPRGGGIAIVTTFLGSILYLAYLKILEPNMVWALTGGGLLIAIIGYLDDLFTVNAKIRMLMHLLAASWAIYWLGPLPFINSFFGSFVAIVGIVWCINFYNFMDGIDGLAGSQGIFAAFIAGFALWWLQAYSMASVMWLLTAAILGFTLWNWPPAKIFLGDVGSGFLGFIFSAFGVYTINHSVLTFPFWLFLLAIFACDATFTLIKRIRQKKKWYAAHREHAYQHLTLKGASHRKVTLGICLLNIFGMLPLAWISIIQPAYAYGMMAISILGLWFLWRMCIT